MKIDQLKPLPGNKRKFHLSQAKYVPERSGCYAITTFDSEILYIGLAINLRNRCEQHLDTPGKTSETVLGRAFWFWYLEWSENHLENLERSWMNLYLADEGSLPVLNKIYSPIS